MAISDSGQQNPEFTRSDSAILDWASSIEAFDRGPQDFMVPGSPAASFGMATDILGPAGSPCSLGDGGSITVGFNAPVVNGPGADFVVFENAFSFEGDVFMEIGFVEVSSDGIQFARMPAICRRTAPMGSFDGAISDDFYNLAGNFVGGTGFDLQDLVDDAHPLVLSGAVLLSAISHIRVVDVIGEATGLGSLDALGNPVVDPYPTDFSSGGMDITGVAVLHNQSIVRVDATSFGAVKSLF
jgi:hypothetical protein